MRIILARHGETTENSQKRISGNSNTAKLTKTGHEHAKKLDEIFKTHKIEAIFSSPLTRAMETVKPLANSLKLKIQPIDELREFDFGAFDGAKERGKAEEFLFKRKRDINFKFPEGESYEDVLKRVKPFLEKLQKNSYKMVFIQGHGGVNRCILSILTKTNPTDLDHINTPNSIVYEIDTKSNECWWEDTLSGETGEGLIFRDKKEI